MDNKDAQNKPWGAKYLVSIYVEGDEGAVGDEILSLLEKLELPVRTEFVGMSMEPVQNKPSDQIAS
jgi:hypothetical protein